MSCTQYNHSPGGESLVIGGIKHIKCASCGNFYNPSQRPSQSDFSKTNHGDMTRPRDTRPSIYGDNFDDFG